MKHFSNALVICGIIAVTSLTLGMTTQTETIPRPEYLTSYQSSSFQFKQPVTDPVLQEETERGPVFETAKFGNYVLTPQQQEVLLIAKRVGEEVGYPETIQAIAMQETLAGGFGDGIGDKINGHMRESYGVMQVKIITAQWVFRHYPDIKREYFGNAKPSKKAIRDLLLNNDEANITIGAYNFALMAKYTTSWRKAVVAYNTGLGGLSSVALVDEHHYYKHVSGKLLSVIRPFNDHAETL